LNGNENNRRLEMSAQKKMIQLFLDEIKNTFEEKGLSSFTMKELKKFVESRIKDFPLEEFIQGAANFLLENSNIHLREIICHGLAMYGNLIDPWSNYSDLLVSSISSLCPKYYLTLFSGLIERKLYERGFFINKKIYLALGKGLSKLLESVMNPSKRNIAILLQEIKELIPNKIYDVIERTASQISKATTLSKELIFLGESLVYILTSRNRISKELLEGLSEVDIKVIRSIDSFGILFLLYVIMNCLDVPENLQSTLVKVILKRDIDTIVHFLRMMSILINRKKIWEHLNPLYNALNEFKIWNNILKICDLDWHTLMSLYRFLDRGKVSEAEEILAMSILLYFIRRNPDDILLRNCFGVALNYIKTPSEYTLKLIIELLERTKSPAQIAQALYTVITNYKNNTVSISESSFYDYRYKNILDFLREIAKIASRMDSIQLVKLAEIEAFRKAVLVIFKFFPEGAINILLMLLRRVLKYEDLLIRSGKSQTMKLPFITNKNILETSDFIIISKRLKRMIPPKEFEAIITILYGFNIGDSKDEYQRA